MLFDPLKVGGMTLANRIAVPAMVTRLSGTDGFVNEEIIQRYKRYAHGGTGLIVVEATAVHEAKSGPLLRLGHSKYIAGHRALVDQVHGESDAKVLPQIIHFLKVARSGWRQTIDSLSIADIESIIEDFADAAARAREAGYDGVELHSAHAYTLASFLSRKNPRRDLYDGRSASGRLRLLTRVYGAVRDKVGSDWPIGVRILADECIKDGSTVEDAKATAQHLVQLGIDYISLSVGGKFEDAQQREGQPLYPYTGYSGDRCMPDHRYPPATNLPAMAAVQEHLAQFRGARGRKVPVLAAGKISTANEAETILRSGHADIIGMARQLLADPDWPKKVAAGQEDPIVRCIYCNVCKKLDESFKQVRCFLWPKGTLHAPMADDLSRPRWPTEGAQLIGETRSNEVLLRWKPATGPGVHRYEIRRADEQGSTTILDAVKGTRYVDRTLIPDNRYTYCVHAYDATGRGTDASNSLSIDFPPQLGNAIATKPDNTDARKS